MPLIKSKSKHAFSENVSKEMSAGKPQKQALAIAYATKRAARKMSKGGDVPNEHDQDMRDKEEADGLDHFAEGGMADMDNWLSDEGDMDNAIDWESADDESMLDKTGYLPESKMDDEEAPVDEADKGRTLDAIMRKRMMGRR